MQDWLKIVSLFSKKIKYLKSIWISGANRLSSQLNLVHFHIVQWLGLPSFTRSIRVQFPVWKLPHSPMVQDTRLSLERSGFDSRCGNSQVQLSGRAGVCRTLGPQFKSGRLLSSHVVKQLSHSTLNAVSLVQIQAWERAPMVQWYDSSFGLKRSPVRFRIGAICPCSSAVEHRTFNPAVAGSIPAMGFHFQHTCPSG